MPNDGFLALLEPRKDEVRELLGTALDDEKQRFIALAIRAVSDPKFDKCTPESKIDCIIQSAAAYLELGTVDKLAFLIPYDNVLTFQPSYVGKIKRIIDAGVALDVYAELVYENDFFEESAGSERRINHKPLRFKDRGRLVGAYAVAQLTNGATAYEVLELADLDAIEKAALRISRGKPSPAYQFFGGEMKKKAAIHRLVKRLQGDRRNPEASERLAATLSADERQFDFDGMRKTDAAAADDLPTARKVTAEFVDDDKADGKKKAARVKQTEDRQVTMSEADELSTMAESAGLGFRQAMAMLKRFGVDEFEDLKHSQIEDVAKAIAAAAAVEQG
jgi:recombination protein RecT